jgi:hypothetical protein
LSFQVGILPLSLQTLKDMAGPPPLFDTSPCTSLFYFYSPCSPKTLARRALSHSPFTWPGHDSFGHQPVHPLLARPQPTKNLAWALPPSPKTTRPPAQRRPTSPKTLKAQRTHALETFPLDPSLSRASC